MYKHCKTMFQYCICWSFYNDRKYFSKMFIKLITNPYIFLYLFFKLLCSNHLQKIGKLKGKIEITEGAYFSLLHDYNKVKEDNEELLENLESAKKLLDVFIR